MWQIYDNNNDFKALTINFIKTEDKQQFLMLFSLTKNNKIYTSLFFVIYILYAKTAILL